MHLPENWDSDVTCVLYTLLLNRHRFACDCWSLADVPGSCCLGKPHIFQSVLFFTLIGGRFSHSPGSWEKFIFGSTHFPSLAVISPNSLELTQYLSLSLVSSSHITCNVYAVFLTCQVSYCIPLHFLSLYRNLSHINIQIIPQYVSNLFSCKRTIWVFSHSCTFQCEVTYTQNSSGQYKSAPFETQYVLCV